MKLEHKEMLDEALALAGVAFGKGRAISDDLSDQMLNLIAADVHQHSTRPCETCRKVTAILGEPFWCLRRAIIAGIENAQKTGCCSP